MGCCGAALVQNPGELCQPPFRTLTKLALEAPALCVRRLHESKPGRRDFRQSRLDLSLKTDVRHYESRRRGRAANERGIVEDGGVVYQSGHLPALLLDHRHRR